MLSGSLFANLNAVFRRYDKSSFYHLLGGMKKKLVFFSFSGRDFLKRKVLENWQNPVLTEATGTFQWKVPVSGIKRYGGKMTELNLLEVELLIKLLQILC